MAFGLLVVISFLVVLVAQVGLSRLRRGQVDVHDVAVPMLRDAHDLESEFSQLVTRALEVSTAASVERLDYSARQLDSLFEELMETAERETLMRSDSVRSEVQPILVQLRGNLDQRAAAQRRLLESRVVLTSSLEEGSRLASGLVEQVEGPILRWSEGSEGSLRELINIRHAGQTLQIILRSLEDLSLLSSVDDLEASYASSLGAAALDAFDLPGESEFKVGLGEALGDLLLLSEGPTGIFELRRQGIRALDQLRELESESNALQGQLRQATGRLKNQTEVNLAQAATNARKTMANTTRWTYLLWGGLLFAAAVILLRYVFGSVVRRLGTLSRELQVMSAGDLSQPVTVTGNDELTALGVAAESARLNTLELSRVSGELRSRNSELKEFAYVASHDLKSPLRAIHNLASWVSEDNDEHLSAESKEHLALLQQRAGKMEIRYG